MKRTHERKDPKREGTARKNNCVRRDRSDWKREVRFAVAR